MSQNLFNAEQEALHSLMDLYDQAKKCRTLFEQAHMALPEPLKRVLGINGTGDKTVASHIAPPTMPPMPTEAETDWIWIRAGDATPTSVVLGILRTNKTPLRARDVNTRVNQILPLVSSGTLSNIGTRLKNKLIRFTDGGWELIDSEKAPVMHREFLWGAPSMFGKMDLAAHRRAAILHILGASPSGLQVMQLVGELHKCSSWVHAPVSKDLVKEDIATLFKRGKVRRRGNTKKWEIVPEKVGESL